MNITFVVVSYYKWRWLQNNKKKPHEQIHLGTKFWHWSRLVSPNSGPHGFDSSYEIIRDETWRSKALLLSMYESTYKPTKIVQKLQRSWIMQHSICLAYLSFISTSVLEFVKLCLARPTLYKFQLFSLLSFVVWMASCDQIHGLPFLYCFFNMFI